MKFALDAPADAYQIRAYDEHEVRIGNQVVRRSCIVSRDALVTDWRPSSLADLTVADLDRIFALEPGIVLLGAGVHQPLPTAEVRAAFAARGIALEPMTLGAACRTFNVLIQDERRIAAALFLT